LYKDFELEGILNELPPNNKKCDWREKVLSGRYNYGKNHKSFCTPYCGHLRLNSGKECHCIPPLDTDASYSWAGAGNSECFEATMNAGKYTNTVQCVPQNVS
jgi:hypothetical protein